MSAEGNQTYFIQYRTKKKSERTLCVHSKVIARVRNKNVSDNVKVVNRRCWLLICNRFRARRVQLVVCPVKRY